MVGRPRKYPKELGKVISKSFAVPEGAVTYLETISAETGQSMTELLGYSIMNIEKEKMGEFFSVMKETREAIRGQTIALKENNTVLAELAQRHESIYSAFKDVDKLPENVEKTLNEELDSMASKGIPQQEAIYKIEEIMDKIESAAALEGKVPKNRQAIKAIVRARILKRLKKSSKIPTITATKRGR